ncbi:MAG: ATP-binding protein [Campylobacterales bacterium]|nr:ATP-binding protein [Campylobacterales bacterium]
MKHLSFNYEDKKNLANAKKKANKKAYTSKLVQLFTSITDKKKIQTILKELKKIFPDAILIGATTAGEISHARMADNSTIISLSLFKETNLKADYVKNITSESGAVLSEKIGSKSTKAAILLSEGLKGEDYEGFLEGFKTSNPHVIIAGGLAGDNLKLKETFVFLDDTIYDRGCVAVSFSGEALYVDNQYNLNWIPIGKEFTITASEGNIVHKIDGISAVEIFSKYLGSDIFKNNNASFPEFPLLYQEGSTMVSRTPMAREGDSLVFAAAIKEGQKVQFGFSNASSILSGAENISETISNNPAEAIYIYSCIARKTLLGKVLESEFKSFENIASTAGFFTYGEYYSTTKNNVLLNCTTTILIVSEKKNQTNLIHKKLEYKHEELGNITFNALTHFVRQTSTDLEFNVKILNQYKNAVDSSLLVSKTDLNGIMTYTNDNFCRVSKYKKEELIGKNHNILRDPTVPKHVFEKLWMTINYGKVWRGQFPNRAKDGSTYYVDATIMPIYDENHNLSEFIAIRQDITKQVIAKNKMQEKDKLIKAIFDNQENIVIYTSKSQGLTYVNQTFFSYFDYKNMEEFKSKHACICELFLDIEGYINPHRDPNWIDTVSNNDQEDHKVKLVFKDKTVHTLKLKVKKIENNDEYLINLFDITSLEKALIQAHASEQAKSIFLANMSHEIRTPLNGILGFTDLLTKKELTNDVKKYVDIVHKSGQTLLNVVNDILDFSKLESGELLLYETESNLFEELEAAVSIFASISKSKHIDYYTFIDTNIPKVLKCDVHRIKQVVNNLLSNAIKFTPINGTVSINVSLIESEGEKAKIHFSIKDSGIGIAKENIATIFQPFSQADNSISRKFGGTGLGLAISSQYVEMMGNILQVRSEIGIGSEFYFDLLLPIINPSSSLEKSFDVKKINIDILYSENEIGKYLNTIISTYLETWKCNYREIKHLNEIKEDTDLLIVSSKLFDQESCQDALDRYEKLQLIYIEGGEDTFSCIHPRFHIVEQPMTGSALFDQIITLRHEAHLEEDSLSVSNEANQFNGKILIAEDNETNQMLIGILLEERGVKYTLVSDGQQAVDEAMVNAYDLIFMDINMPILDGISAINVLRANGYTKPIVSLSANVITKDIETFIEAGANDTLNKPIIPHELDTILAKYLNTHEKLLSMPKRDIVDLNTLAKDLGLPNKAIILSLLKSFESSAKRLVKKLESNDWDGNLLHTLKGMSGNLRFNELYTFVCETEKRWDDLDENQKNQKKDIIRLHLQGVIEQIDSLNE